ncbi:MAG: hypothetical protein HDR40_06100 [Lactobacillus sp.]|nr:hypothetical protein [Lactobacillus sp.]
MMKQMEFKGVEIDRQATAALTKYFLKYEVDHYRRVAGVIKIDLSSPTLGVASSHSGSNSSEKSMMRAFQKMEYAQNVLRAVGLAYRSCDMTSQIILKYSCFENYSDIQLLQKVPYQSRSITKLKQRAFCQFAEAMIPAKVKFNCEGLHDLLIEKKSAD